LKNEEECAGAEADDDMANATVADQTVVEKAESGEAFQNFVAVPTKKSLRKSKIFNQIFSVYRQ
jgi:hypothetical protein